MLKANNSSDRPRSGKALPKEWRVVALGEVARTQYGISAPSCHGGSIPIVGMKNIQDGSIDLTIVDRVQLADSELPKYCLRNGDILFNRTNSQDLVGKTAIFSSVEGQTFVFASYLIRISADSSILLPAFLCYYMNTMYAEAVLKSIATPGVSQYNINPTTLTKTLKVPLPSIAEQGAICKVLQGWDRLISLVRELRSSKCKLKEGMMQQLLTGRRRHPMFVKTKWTSYHLGDLFSERNETGREDLRLLSITADRGVIPRDEVERKDSSSEDKSGYKRIVPGDIGYNTMRMWQGVSALAGLEGIVSPAYTVCVPNDRVDARFASYLFKFPPTVHMFYRYSQGLVDDTLSLKFPNFVQIKVTIPPIEEQVWISSVLRSVDKEIELLREYEICLSSQKKALMEKLLAGHLRIREAIRA